MLTMAYCLSARPTWSYTRWPVVSGHGIRVYITPRHFTHEEHSYPIYSPRSLEFNSNITTRIQQYIYIYTFLANIILTRSLLRTRVFQCWFGVNKQSHAGQDWNVFFVCLEYTPYIPIYIYTYIITPNVLDAH